MGRIRSSRGAILVPLVLAAIAAAAGAPAAGAATLTLADPGEHPAIAVDEAETGHVVWSEAVAAGADRLIYCRLPRGASACAQTQSFALPDENFDGPHVLAGNGEVILVASRCCSGQYAREQMIALRSVDGGLSFGAPTTIGDTDLFHGGVAFGPGNSQISTVGAPTEGVLYQAEPLDGPTVPYTQRALLLGGTAPAIISSVAMLDPLTPAVAYSDFDGQSFARIYDRSGSYNDAANWLPPSLPLAGDDSKIAGGLRGLYLLRRPGAPGKQRYVVDRYDPLTGAFGSTQSVSPAGDPIFRDFIEDAGGNLHAVWVQNDEEDEPVYLSQSGDGRTWAKPKKLASSSDDAYNLRVGAGPDGGGWAVWNTESGGGAVKAAPFEPIVGGGGSCVPSVTYGKVAAIATEGCFTKQGNEYTTDGAVRVNGLDLTPEGSAEITIDKGKGTLESSGKVLAKAGNVELDLEKLGWNLPKQGGELKDLAGNPAVFDAATEPPVEFLGMEVSGWVGMDIEGNQAGVFKDVDLELPQPFGTLLGDKITAKTDLHLDNSRGLVLDGAQVGANSIWLGIAEVKTLHINYLADPFVLQGDATLLLPVIQSELATQFGLLNGEFDYGRATLTFLDPGLAVSGFTYLRSVGFEVETDPTRIAGTVVATAGPTLTLGGTPYAALTVDGTISYIFSDPGIFTAEGSGQIFNVQAATAKAEFITSGKLSLTGDFSIPAGLVKLSGSVNGEVSLNNGAFNLGGFGEGCGMKPIPGCISGIKVLVSSKAASGCASAVSVTLPEPIGEVELAAGVAYTWGGGFTIFAGCDLSPYEATVTSAEARAARVAGAPLRATVPKGLDQVNFAITGSGAPPQVTITGPGGVSVSSAANPDGTATGTAGILTQSDADDTAYAALPNPLSGEWIVTAVGGSAPITGIQQASSLPQPKVKGSVHDGKGRKRTLRYEVKKIEGQVVRFFEAGEFGRRLIGTAKGKRGRIEFSVADGPGGTRTIEADIESFGIPRDVLTVASYRAPAPITPGTPRNLRVRRQGTKAIVSWRKAPNASSYIVEAALADGRRLSIETKRTKLTIRDVPGIDSARIGVAGLKTDNTHGKVAHERLKAKPKKRRHHR